MSDFKFLATCPKGLGSLLKPELEALGAGNVRETITGVTFEGERATGYRACLHSRFANRVLLQLSEFAAASADDLYQGILRLPWHEHLRSSGTLVVDFSGRSNDIRNTQFGAQRCKDGVVDQFRSRGLERPSVDTKQPDLRINVRLYKGKVTVAIDLSGSSLHRRGYRTDPGKAPLKENLAAAVLARAGWPAAFAKGWPLIDPMCGAGTLLIEAAMMATNHAPGLGRESWGFDGWLGHNPAQWRAIVEEARAQVVEAPEGVEIRGYDGDIRAVRRAEAAVAELGLEQLIRVRPKALNELSRPSHRPMPDGLVICNPPWGERLGTTDAMRHLYRQLGEKLHGEFQGWHAAILTSNPELGRAVGLRSHKQYGFNNGALDIQLLLFDLTPDNHLSREISPTATQPKGLSVEVASGVGLAESGAAAPVSSANIWGEVKSAEPPQEQGSQISALSPGAQMFANRLKKNQRRLKNWLKRSGTTCYRLYDADMPEYAVAVDIYEGQPHVAEYAPPKQVSEDDATRRFEECILGTRVALGLPPTATVATKRRQRQRGREQYGKFGERKERITVREGAARLLVNLHDYLDTGLFLDHRPLRLRLAEEAKGRHFLNLFCYTGAASVHAALAGATTSTSVDLSNTYLNWYRENLALNGLSERQHRAVKSDVMEWLTECDRKFDLIMLDPPSFSNSKSTETSFDVARDQVRLVELAMAALEPGGVLYFSNNRRGFRLADELTTSFQVENITPETIPEDYARSPGIHQCWRIKHPHGR